MIKNLIMRTIILAASVALSGTAQAAIVAYEGFDYNPTDASIDGSHLGTANPDWVHKWGVHQVLTTGLTYGSLPVSGASVRKDPYGDPVINTGRKHPDYQNTAMASDIAAAGLLADGATLWASILIDTPTSITNSGAYFTIGTHHVNFNGNTRNLTTYALENGDAVGLKISNTTLQSASWQNQNAGTYGTLQAMPAGTHLYVMEMVWGATTDTINFYLPGTDLTLGTAVGSINVSVDNANFATASLSNINGDPYIFDEVRFGASYADVIGESSMNPNPGNGALIDAANPLTLSWTNLDPDPAFGATETYVDVWFGTDAQNMTQVVFGQALSTVVVDASAMGTYYWCVDSYLAGQPGDGTGGTVDYSMGQPAVVQGVVWSFDTQGFVPGLPTNPYPLDFGIIPTTNPLSLSWFNTEPDPASGATETYVDVWFGTDAQNMTQVVFGQALSTVVVNASAVGTYYWRVDSYLAGQPGDGTGGTVDYSLPGEPDVVQGNLWSFQAQEEAPPTYISDEPLKVFILAGQSNMVGYGSIGVKDTTTPGTLWYMAQNDPKYYSLLDLDGNWVVREDVYCWYYHQEMYSSNHYVQQDYLRPGFGHHTGLIGPEYGFGFMMGDFYDAPVLILKSCVGGTGLATDWRPPSSGGETGYLYDYTVNLVNDFKANPAAYCPLYNPAHGYEIVGLGWHQGVNDSSSAKDSAEYEFNLKNLIKDLRQDLGLSNLLVSISMTGMRDDGYYPVVQQAQLAMEDYVSYPDHERNVTVDDTHPYWRDASESPMSQWYHWNRNALSYSLIGEGMAQGMQEVLIAQDVPFVNAAPNKVTWSGQPVQMDPTIAERNSTSWTNLEYTWTAIPADGAVFDPSPDVPNPTVTITKATANPSEVTLMLAVNDASRIEPGLKTPVYLDVYDTACKAAYGIGAADSYPEDLSVDCVLNLEDLAIIAAEWLLDGSLNAPVQIGK